MTLTVADWVIVAIVGLSTIVGLWRGFVKEVLSVVVWIAAVLITYTFSDSAAVALEPHIESESVRGIAAIAVLFIFVLVTGTLVTTLIAKIVEATGLSGTDRLLGSIFGLIRGVLLMLSAFMLIPHIAPIDQTEWYQQSELIPHILLLEDWVVEITKGLQSSFGSLLESEAVQEVIE